jgi:hypothetical protein
MLVKNKLLRVAGPPTGDYVRKLVLNISWPVGARLRGCVKPVGARLQRAATPPLAVVGQKYVVAGRLTRNVGMYAEGWY